MFIAGLISLMLVAADGAELILDGTFAKGFESWRHSAANPDVQFSAAKDGDKTFVRIVVPPTVEPAYPLYWQEFPARTGQLFEGEVEAAAKDVTGGYGVYAALEFYDAKEKRISFSQTEAARKEGGWTILPIRTVAPPGTVMARLAMLINGHGEGRFARASIKCGGDVSPAALVNPVTIKVAQERACETFKGFGAEDDGWFYGPDNAAHGVAEGDYAVREGRIDWMQPDWIRMFFWYRDWCPKDDWENFTFDSPNMQSHYRTLDQYQRLGACVNIVGVEWGIAKPYAEPEKAAKAIGALLEHLTKVKGYTCVQEWTLTNEPNGHWMNHATFEEFVRIHSLVKKEITQRGLAVRVVGSGDTNGLTWFSDCLKSEEYHASADLYASHRYISFPDRMMMSYFLDDRLERLKTRDNSPKPLVVAEFGFQDGRSGTLENPIMEEYPYALWTSAFVLEGLNKGISGFSIWCLHETYYPGNGFMNYGLWNFKNRNWSVRPVYYLWADFSRLTRAGDPVFRCESSSPAHVLASRIGDVLFWVNQCDSAADLVVEGMPLKEVRVHEETTLSGDRECGNVLKLTDGKFKVPPLSFGFAR
jgi:hypothetical protein